MAEFVITMVIIGAIARYAARLIVPGRDPIRFGHRRPFPGL